MAACTLSTTNHSFTARVGTYGIHRTRVVQVSLYRAHQITPRNTRRSYGHVDAEFKENMTKEEAQQFVRKAISHAMARDGSSGGVIRMVVIDKTGVRSNQQCGMPIFVLVGSSRNALFLHCSHGFRIMFECALGCLDRHAPCFETTRPTDVRLILQSVHRAILYVKRQAPTLILCLASSTSQVSREYIPGDKLPFGP